MNGCPFTEPPWLASLPRLSTGSPQFFGANGRPARYRELPSIPASFPGDTAGDSVRALALAIRRRCAICGCSLPTERVYHLWYQGPSWEEWPGGVWTHYIPGPMHKSCAIYSAMACPWLQYPNSKTKYRQDREKVKRGQAAIVEFGQYGIAFFEKGTHDTWAFGYYDDTEWVRYGTYKELRPWYVEAVAADAKLIDCATRLYWADNTGLTECSRRDKPTLVRLRTSAVTWVNGYGYRLAVL